jgi:hypothetical protein
LFKRYEIRRPKDRANKAVSNSNSKGILNRCYSKGIGGQKDEEERGTEEQEGRLSFIIVERWEAS